MRNGLRYPAWAALRWLPVAILALALATALTAVLESGLGIADASVLYLLAVVVTASLYGTWPAVAVSAAAFLVYDFLFTTPRLTLVVADPQEWLSLLLFLVVAVVIGRLTALQSARAAEAERRAGETEALFSIARSLAVADSTHGAALEIADRLRSRAAMGRVWIALGPTSSQERLIADTAPGERLPDHAVIWALHRTARERAPGWVRVHVGGADTRTRGRARADHEESVYRVPIEAESRTLGAISGTRTRPAEPPDAGETRLLSLAADQLGLVLRRQELTAEVTSAEVARRSDALKSSLVDSVSHDLRTPLTTIRALAGSLLDPDVTVDPVAGRDAARMIDAEAERLGLIVTNLLDLSRIEGGALRPEPEIHDLADLVSTSLRRHAPSLQGHEVVDETGRELPPVLVDPLFFEQALGNVLENAARHAGAGSPIRLRSERPNADGGDGRVDLVVEDAGRGVPKTELSRLFERFYRVPGTGAAGGGMGIGLSVARGYVVAMHGDMTAESSPLGGLAIRIRVPLAQPPEPVAAEAPTPAAAPRA